MAREKKTFRVSYRKDTPIRDDLEHLINTNTMSRTPVMLESGIIEKGDERTCYHDVRIFFPAAPRLPRKDAA